MSIHRSSLPLLALAATALGGATTATAAAATTHHTPTAAMRKGIRDYARSVDASASRVAVTCGAATRVGRRATCVGTFRLAAEGARADYRLGTGARVLRISPHALEYRVVARATAPAAGLPRRVTGFSGFLQ